MMYFTHVPAGVVAGLMYQAATPDPTLISVATACAFGGLGALLPDIDSKSSKISQALPFVSAPVRFLTKIMNPDKQHLLHIRGITHELWFWALACLFPMFYIGSFPTFGIALFVGAFSHLVLDACNPSGIAFLAPISNKRTRFLKIPTGSWGERVFGGFVTIVGMGFVGYLCDKIGLIPI